MPAFLDTSALIKYFAEETGMEEIRRLVESGTPLWVSELTTIEAVSALAKKVRKTEISANEFHSLRRALVLFLNSGRCEIIPLDDAAKERAFALLTTWALSRTLGSLDALQLAAALRAKEEVSPLDLDFYSADRQLSAAAEVQGFTVRIPGVTKGSP